MISAGRRASYHPLAFYTFHLLRIIQMICSPDSTIFCGMVHGCLSNGQNMFIPFVSTMAGYMFGHIGIIASYVPHDSRC